MKKGDRLLLIAIAIAIILTFAIGQLATPRSGTGGDGASKPAIVIRVDGKIYRTIPLELKGRRTFTIRTRRGGYELLEIQDGKVRIAESNCPEQVCVRTGWISRPGQSIICVPNRVMVYIDGSGDGVDVVAY
ncbi:MAG TPA: NusG domain II-containing protein [Firmicutes bacterium]|nr:NusG domain II-containing protein [Bacillota bacterium]